MLMVSKTYEAEGISKRKLADMLGVSPNSIQAWRQTYINGGLNALLSHNKKGYKKTIFTTHEQDFMKQSLYIYKGHGRFKKIVTAMEAYFQKQYKYTTVLNFIKAKWTIL